MSVSTQQTLENMGNSEDEDSDYIDIVVPTSQKPRRRTIKRTVNRFSLSQPEPSSRKRKCKSPEPEPDDDNPIDLHKLMKLLTKMSKEVHEMKVVVNKELPAIKSSIATVTTELEGIKAKIATVAPPINLENNLSKLTEKVEQVSQKVAQGTAPADLSKQLEDIFEVQLKLKQRRTKYFDYHSYSERLAIYSSWEQLDPPFIQSKYLPGLIENEPQEEYEARKRKAENNRICDLELLSLRSQRAKTALDSIDQEVATAIRDHDVQEDVKLKLTQHWLKLVQAEEVKSRKIWEKTAKNLLEAPKREVDTNRIIVQEGRSYASVLKNSQKKKKDADKADEMEVDCVVPEEPIEQNQWTTANTKNSRSHKARDEKQQPAAPQTVKYKPSQNDGRPPSFRKRGPKFKPKYHGNWNQGQNRWGYQHQQWW